MHLSNITKDFLLLILPVSLPLVPKLLSKPMTFCEVDPYYLKQNFCDKPVESRSKETWKEVSYGYYFKFDSNELRNNEANCNLPHPTELVKLPLESHSHDRINFACSLKQEVVSRTLIILCTKIYDHLKKSVSRHIVSLNLIFHVLEEKKFLFPSSGT